MGQRTIQHAVFFNWFLILCLMPCFGTYFFVHATAEVGATTTIVVKNANQSATKPITQNESTSERDKGFLPWENKEMFVRALIVVACVSLIAVVYLVIRCLRVKHQMSKSRKYGLITSNEDKMELRPLGQEDEEDDLTVFDRTSTGQTTQRSFDLAKNGMKVKDKAP